MKLLTPNQVKDTKNQELARDVIRAKEVEKVIQDTNYRLVNAQADFSSTMAKFKETWAREEEEHSKRIAEMTKEIEELEDRRKKALIPLQIEQDKAYTIMKEAKEALNIALQKQERLDETQEILEQRLTEVSDREHTISVKENNLQVRSEGIEIQAKQISSMSEKLTEDIEKFQEHVKEEEEKLNERKKDITLIEINLIARENKVKRDVEAINQEWIKIKDQRETLERAIKRI